MAGEMVSVRLPVRLQVVFFSRRLGSINESVSNPGKMSTTSVLVHGIVPGAPPEGMDTVTRFRLEEIPMSPKTVAFFCDFYDVGRRLRL